MLDNGTKSIGAATSIRQETVAVYVPIIRTYLLFIAAYYVFVSYGHFRDYTGAQLLGFASLSMMSTIAALLLRNSFKDTATFATLEAVGAIGNTLLLINLQYYYLLSYDPDRLIYFILMIFVCSITSISRRLGVISCAVVLACLYIAIVRYDPALLQTYFHIGVASALIAVFVSLTLRNVIYNALGAKLYAAQQREEAVVQAERATKLSITDPLTQLPNRRDFFDLLGQLSSYPPKKGRWAVLMIDLDGFKPVNDGYGHQVGDKLLVAVSKRLTSKLPSTVRLARIGGDEFAALMQVQSTQELAKIGEQVCAAMRAPFNVERVVVHVGASVGGAIQEHADMPLIDVLENADYALFNVKKSTKGQCSLFTKADAGKMKRLFIVEQVLRRCDLEKELSVVYQPQFDLLKRRITAYESLARWKSTELGDVSPMEFIAVAESTGLITEITQVLLRKALRDFEKWPANVALSFNLSVHDILNEDAINNILKITSESGIAPERICFEITETVVMREIEKATAALRKLRTAKHEIALDDFGTGYSNFAHLHRLPVQKIKIDRSFIRNIAQRERSGEVITAMIRLIRSLNKVCIIEGVETEAEFAAIQLMGARYVQGYYCGRPISASEVLRLETEVEEHIPTEPRLNSFA